MKTAIFYVAKSTNMKSNRTYWPCFPAGSSKRFSVRCEIVEGHAFSVTPQPKDNEEVLGTKEL